MEYLSNDPRTVPEQSYNRDRRVCPPKESDRKLNGIRRLSTLWATLVAWELSCPTSGEPGRLRYK